METKKIKVLTYQIRTIPIGKINSVIIMRMIRTAQRYADFINTKRIG